MSEIRPLPNTGALIVNFKEINKKLIVVSDLHLGLEYRTHNDIVIEDPRFVQFENELSNLITSNKANYLVLLGDVKNNIFNISNSDWKYLLNFFNVLSNVCEVYFIPGNHDSKISSVISDSINLVGSGGMIIDDVLFTHGHTLPKVRPSVRTIIMGHIHPVFFKTGSILNGQRVWIFLKFKKKLLCPESTGLIDLILMPSFNRYTSYAEKKNERKKMSSPLLRKLITNKVVDSSLIVGIDGSILGDISNLNDIL
jgi:uncharacterized protein